MRDEIVRRKRKRGSRVVRYLALGVFLLAAWVLSANTILQPYLAPAPAAQQIAADVDAGALPDAAAVLPVLTAPAMTRLAAATQPAMAEPSDPTIAEALPGSTEKANTVVVTASLTPVRLASAAPTVGGADISDAAVIAKAVEPASEAPPKAAPAPRVRPRVAAIPLPRPRPQIAQARSTTLLGRLFGAR